MKALISTANKRTERVFLVGVQLKSRERWQVDESLHELAELATTRLTPIGGEMRRLMADPVEIDRILDDGARRAHAIADPILAMTKDIVGFIRS